MTNHGVLGTIRNVSPASQISRAPEVATDASGDSVITWVHEDGARRRQRRRAGAHDDPQRLARRPSPTLSEPAGRAFSPDVASDADGDTTFVWLRFDGTRDHVQGRVMTAAGALGAVFNLTSTGPSAVDPRVASDDTGDAVFVWERFDAPTDRIQARTRTAGVLGAVVQVSAVGGEAFSPQVASDATGDSVITWLRFDGVNDRVQARPITAAGAFGATSDLSAAGADAETPQVAIAKTTGDAVATWERAGTVQVARGP